MNTRTYSKEITTAINNFLNEDDWHFSFDEQRGSFNFGLTLKSKIKHIKYIVEVKEDEFLVYAISPIGADEDDEKMMTTMAEFVCRANYGLKNGNFELDMRDGEIRYKSFVSCEGITPTPEMIKRSIYCPTTMFEQYSNGIVDIILGNATAKAAIDKCEKASEEELRSIIAQLVEDDDSGDMDVMMARLAARLGIDEVPSGFDSEESEQTISDIKIDLFESEGGDE